MPSVVAGLSRVEHAVPARGNHIYLALDGAAGVAPVAGLGVPVVALLAELVDPVTALRRLELAELAASIVRLHAAVVARFTGLLDTVSATLDRAAGAAAVPRDRPAVVALFAVVQIAVTARSLVLELTQRAAAVPASVFAVVALLALPRIAVSAGLRKLQDTVLVAAVAVLGVRVVAVLSRLDDPVAAELLCARRRTPIAVGPCPRLHTPRRGRAPSRRRLLGACGRAPIPRLEPSVVARLGADLNESVSARRDHAPREARPAFVEDAVVAALVRLDDGVSTELRDALRRAAVAVRVVAVVALLVRLHDPISADLVQAEAAASVAVDRATVVAILERLDHAVAARERLDELAGRVAPRLRALRRVALLAGERLQPAIATRGEGALDGAAVELL